MDETFSPQRLQWSERSAETGALVGDFAQLLLRLTTFLWALLHPFILKWKGCSSKEVACLVLVLFYLMRWEKLIPTLQSHRDVKLKPNELQILLQAVPVGTARSVSDWTDPAAASGASKMTNLISVREHKANKLKLQKIVTERTVQEDSSVAQEPAKAT